MQLQGLLNHVILCSLSEWKTWCFSFMAIDDNIDGSFNQFPSNEWTRWRAREGARGRQRQWSQLLLRGGSTSPLLLLQVLHSHLLSLHPNTHSANLYCPFLQLLLLLQPLSALRLIPLPQDLLYDYFFCRYRPLPVEANPLNYQDPSRQYFIPGTKNRPASTPDFLLRPLWEARPCPCHHLLYTVSMFERAGMR